MVYRKTNLYMFPISSLQLLVANGPIVIECHENLLTYVFDYTSTFCTD